MLIEHDSDIPPVIYMSERQRPNLDITCSIWALREFVKGMRTCRLEFRSFDWDGTGMRPDDMAIGIPAGGRGLQPKDTSIFSWIVKTYAEPYGVEALLPIMSIMDTYIEAQGLYYAADVIASEVGYGELDTLAMTGLEALFHGLQAFYPRDPAAVLEVMSVNLSSLFKAGLNRYRISHAGEDVEMISEGVYLLHGSSPDAIRYLFDRDALMVIYTDRNNMGIITQPEMCLPENLEGIREVIAAAGESDEWTMDDQARVYARGTPLRPASTPSKVHPRALAEAVVETLREAKL